MELIGELGAIPPEGLCTTQTIPIDSSMIYNYDNYRITVIIINITN